MTGEGRVGDVSYLQVRPSWPVAGVPAQDGRWARDPQADTPLTLAVQMRGAGGSSSGK